MQMQLLAKWYRYCLIGQRKIQIIHLLFLKKYRNAVYTIIYVPILILLLADHYFVVNDSKDSVRYLHLDVISISINYTHYASFVSSSDPCMIHRL